mmetsp:Transcript_80230/g.259201  ORF Transcript_80230/g.259201 Transcript_80230/m.259201 type:complete len:264 (-) Transcript_80230:160-951(-)
MEVWSGPQLRRRSSDGYRCNKCAGRHRSTDRELCCLGKDSLAGLAQEVGNAHDAAVVHAFAFCQLEAQPLSLGELHLADVLHGGLPALPSDRLAQRSCSIGSFLLRWQILDLLICIRRRLRAKRRSLRSTGRQLGCLGEDSFARRALEVRHAHDVAIVHANAVCEFKAHPLTFGELHLPDVLHCGRLTVPLDRLPKRNRAVGRLVSGWKRGRPLVICSCGCHNHQRGLTAANGALFAPLALQEVQAGKRRDARAKGARQDLKA